MIDREKFFTSIRGSLFNGVLSQTQVDGMNYLLDTWENYFVDSDIRWLAYALATAFHETAYTMQPIEEYGRGEGHDYGKTTGPYGEKYYGRGHVQLTWIANYEKAQARLKDIYEVEAPLVEYPHRMLEDEPSALVLFDGSIQGWFTGVGLPQYFDADTEDPYNARRVINGTDKADLIAGYYTQFKNALT
jgi:predicted chitinase